MCGIAGILQASPGRYNLAHLKKMTDAIAHRGPDGEGHWENTSSQVLFGHRRLSIIDLSSAASQPMHYANRYTIVFNGAIYNYVELKNELSKIGHLFNSNSDTEVILAAYQQWGKNCVQYFDGMFAFAIWDNDEKSLFAARDRFGEKPFYYLFDGDSFLFASEIKALWAIGCKKEINRRLLFNFISIGYTDNPANPQETFYQNINTLPAASQLYLSCNNMLPQISTYWTLSKEQDNFDSTSEEDCIEEFSYLLQTSVERRLRSDVSIGCSLNGGIDSSSIVAIIKTINPSLDFLKTFTAIFPGFEKDESAFATTVANKFHLDAFTISPSANDLASSWDKLCYQQEEPFGSAHVYLQFKVYELAKQNNCTVLLDGQGADEVLAGYHKYYKWYWQELFIKRKLKRSGELKFARKNAVAESFGIKNIAAAFFPDLATMLLEQQYLAKAIQHPHFNRDFVQEQSNKTYYSMPGIAGLNDALHFSCINHGLGELLRIADKNSMANGREVRLPFLNHELVEFVFSLPSNFKIRNGFTKWLLRKTMTNKLPDEVLWKTDKVGYAPPQKNWMQTESLKAIIMDARKKLIDEKVLNPSVLQNPIQPSDSYSADAYDWRYLAAAAFI